MPLAVGVIPYRIIPQLIEQLCPLSKQGLGDNFTNLTRLIGINGFRSAYNQADNHSKRECKKRRDQEQRSAVFGRGFQ